MRNRDDFNLRWQDAVYEIERIFHQYETSPAEPRDGITCRRFADALDCMVDFASEACRRSSTTSKVPINCRADGT
jgi:hypothetical protein